MKAWALFLFIISSTFYSKSQELPPIQNFLPTDYKAGHQNWSISQSDNKLIYVANNEGLLEFNGSKWQLYPSPNESIMRSVKVVDERIYSGCYMEFGFWTKNEFGSLEYTSISAKLNIDLVDDEEFWHILEIDDRLIFQSLSSIYIYDPTTEKVDVIESNEEIINIYSVSGLAYFQRIDKGLYKIENGNEVLVSDYEVFKQDEIIQIFKILDNTLIITKHNGFYSLDKDIKKLNLTQNSLDDISVYCASKLTNNQIALGTISHGLIYLDETLSLLYEINQQNGISNNTILSAFEDMDGNLWTGLDNGLSYININSSIKVYKDIYGEIGSVYASAFHNNILYLGTNQGLYYRENEKDPFQFVKGTEGQVWSLSIIDSSLFCGHHKGTFLVENRSAELIAQIPGTWGVSIIKDHSNLILQGNYDGLYVIEKEDKSWKLRNKIEGFNNSARHFEIHNNRIFINHEYKGFYILKVDDKLTSAESIKEEPELKGANSSIKKINDNILFSFKEGIYSFDEKNEKFIKNEGLSNIYNEYEYVSGKMILDADESKFWIFTKNHIIQVASSSFSNKPKVLKLPIGLDVRGDVEEYQNIIEYKRPNQYLVGNSSGYLIFDVNQFEIGDFEISINEIANGVIKDHPNKGVLINRSEVNTFDNDENNFKISFYTPVYQKIFQPLYQFQLKGIYNEWSAWTEESIVFFENLPPGDYEFNVRAKSGNQISKNVASYRFVINRPWYFTNFMLILYVAGVIAFSIMMHTIYKSYYKSQRERLVKENKRNMELTLLQNEKEIIKLKNKQLKEDYKSKSKELAASTMSIVRKNEILNEIKDQLKHIEDQSIVKPVVKIIDKNLSHTGNWELFKEAFDNVDSEFLKKLKNQHPNLSPNDLKLCAYLRLNLSSKEVSQLINISPRSVEVKRYRLRKKLNLASDENLSDHILSI